MRALLATLVLLLALDSAAAHQDSYPMPGADYKARAAQRIARYKQRVEEHMTAQKLDEATRKRVRKRMTELATTLNALVEKVASDGTVTLDEANQVKQAGKQARDAIYRDFKLEPDKKPAKPKPKA